MPGWGMGWGWIGMILLLMILILAIVGLFRALDRGGGPGGVRGSQRDTAVEVLRERFARGEIDREELESRKRELEP